MDTFDPALPAGNSLHRFNETSAKFQRYKVLLRRRWWFLLLTAAIAICYQALSITGKRTEFEAQGRIVAGVQVQLGDKATSMDSRFMEDFYGTQIEMLESSRLKATVLDRVRGLHPDLREIPVKIRVTQTKGSSILNVLATGEEAKFTSVYLNALLDEYMNMRKDMFENSINNTMNKVIEEVYSREKIVKESKRKYEEFLLNNDQTLFADSRNQSAAYLATLKNTLSVLETEKSIMEKMGIDDYLRQRSQGAGGLPPSSSQSSASIAPDGGTVPGTGDSGVVTGNLGIGGISRVESEYLESQTVLQSLEAERERLLRTYRPEHPIVKELVTKVDTTRSRIVILGQQTKEEWSRRVKSLDVRMAALKDEIKVWDVKARESNEKIVTQLALKSEYERNLQDYQDWKSKLAQLNAAGVIGGEPVAIMERPSPLAIEKEPELWTPLLVALLIGLVSGGLILLLFDRLDDRMNSFSEFQALFPNEAVLGQIPDQSSRGDVAILRSNDDRHLYAEAFRNLRSSILFKNWRGGRPPKVILVTSAVPNEGKTTTVTNMAVTMALGGARVLLVDADLRRGGVNELFKISAEPGLSDVLTAKAHWRDAVHDTTTKGLHVLPRGEALDQTSELFLSPLAAEIIKEMGEEYDYVIFDSAPVLVADDTASFAPKVDTVLFVVRMSSTMARLSAKALDLLYERQVNVGGIILNRSSTNLKEYTYYNYASYYTVSAQKGTKSNS